MTTTSAKAITRARAKVKGEGEGQNKRHEKIDPQRNALDHDLDLDQDKAFDTYI